MNGVHAGASVRRLGLQGSLLVGGERFNRLARRQLDRRQRRQFLGLRDGGIHAGNFGVRNFDLCSGKLLGHDGSTVIQLWARTGLRGHLCRRGLRSGACLRLAAGAEGVKPDLGTSEK
ncbi:MAG: hypothetical protein IAE97_06355 [Chthoniobacterales bacterium]|nr:hypothetical protein [Chthoniobacterales bacterium]